MICIFCGKKIRSEQPVPIPEIRFAPVVPYVPGITPARLGETVLHDRLCCLDCYDAILQNDSQSIREVSQIDADKP